MKHICNNAIVEAINYYCQSFRAGGEELICSHSLNLIGKMSKIRALKIR